MSAPEPEAAQREVLAARLADDVETLAERSAFDRRELRRWPRRDRYALAILALAGERRVTTLKP